MPASPPVPLSRLLAAAEGVLQVHRAGDVEPLVSEVVLYGEGDPPPPHGALVLAACPVPVPVGVVVARDPATVPAGSADAVVTIAPQARWADVFDLLRRCLSEQVGELGEDDLFTLADALASAVGGAVAVEDAQRRVLAFSAIAGQPIDQVRRDGILGRQVPEHVERDEWYRRLWRSSGVVEYQPGPQSSARLAVAVVAGGERLGSIWVVGDRRSLTPGADDELLRAVPAVARSLLHQQRYSSRSRDARAALLRRLLAGEQEPPPADARPACVVVGVIHDVDAPDRELLEMRLADLLSLHAQRLGNTALAAALDGVVYAVLPWIDRPLLEKQLHSAWSRSPGKLRAAVSTVVDDVTGSLPAAAHSVRRLLAMGGAGEGVVRYVEDVRDQLLLNEIGAVIAEAVPALDGALAARIRAHDRDQGTHYAQTLAAYFEHNGDVTAAAGQLHVHPNTFRYRIARAVEIFELDFGDADQRLLLHLQLRLFPDS
jgi:hypothetical protein